MGRLFASSAPALAGVTATAPCRVDLAGGTLDMWPLYLFHHDSVTVNFAVNILATFILQPSHVANQPVVLGIPELLAEGVRR